MLPNGSTPKVFSSRYAHFQKRKRKCSCRCKWLTLPCHADPCQENDNCTLWRCSTLHISTQSVKGFCRAVLATGCWSTGVFHPTELMACFTLLHLFPHGWRMCCEGFYMRISISCTGKQQHAACSIEIRTENATLWAVCYDTPVSWITAACASQRNEKHKCCM